ncbi:MAG: GNAT family N-acetyltransferase [Candidatus Methanocorpusculum faecipullorum]|nr:GNAT family N-acetyltransferase [Candidatus Methanocorpusculum faecipullorum]
MESIRVRPYSSADYPSICELDAPLFAGMGGPVLFRHIEELFPSLFFVAENAEKDIIGYILGGIHLDDPKTGKLIRIGVVQNYQRKECGTKLTEALFSAMKERNVTAVHLTVAETNKPAIAFYQKIGFIQKERIQNYFYPTTPRLVLWKTL